MKVLRQASVAAVAAALGLSMTLVSATPASAATYASCVTNQGAIGAIQYTSNGNGTYLVTYRVYTGLNPSGSGRMYFEANTLPAGVDYINFYVAQDNKWHVLSYAMPSRYLTNNAARLFKSHSTSGWSYPWCSMY